MDTQQGDIGIPTILMPCKEDITNIEGALGFSRGILDSSREIFYKDGRVIMTAFIFATKIPNDNSEIMKKPSPIILMDGMIPNFDKDMFSDTIKKVAEMTSAIGTLFVSETWMLSSNLDRDSFDRDRQRYTSLEFHPERKECIYAVLEHRYIKGAKTWIAEITRDKYGKGTLDEYKEMDSTITEGRFSNLNPDYNKDLSKN